MSEYIEIVFVRTWWTYSPENSFTFDTIYHWFNIFEGLVWTIFAALVCRRYKQSRHSSLEIWYCFAFISFAITDFLEAFSQSSWLIWLKATNLILLFHVRRTVMMRHYPNARVY